MIFAFGIALAKLPRLSIRIGVAVPLIAVLGLTGLMQKPIKIGAMSFALRLSPEWGEALESLFLLDNWHLLFGLALLTAIAAWRSILTSAWLPRTWIVAMGLGLISVAGILSMPPLWYGGLRDFSYAGIHFAAVLVFWIASVARTLAPRHAQSSEVDSLPA